MYRSVIAQSLRRAGRADLVDEREAELFETILGAEPDEQERRLARNIAARRYLQAHTRGGKRSHIRIIGAQDVSQ